ncbi:S41 family peptidase [Anaerolineales bacterium HSG6]|nr:S41 family peptidase [Anaerolineales bacterium HSG6]
MAFNNKQQPQPAWLKISAGLTALIIVMGCTFISGMLFHANIYAQSGAPRLSIVSAADSSAPSGVPSVNGPANTPKFDTFWEAWFFLNEEFYGDVPIDDERMYGAIRGMLKTFDDQHTAFIDPVRAGINRENMGGSFEGIGASLRLDDSGQLMIADPFPDRPAILAGLRPGDIILKIDGESADSLSLYEAVSKIRGPANTPVVLTIFRDGESAPLDVTIVRAKIEIEVVQGELLSERVAHIRLTTFSNGASDKVLREFQNLQNQGANRIILDLRSNPGGLLSEAVDVSSLFVNGPITVEKMKGGKEKIFTSDDSHQGALDVPLVVLVNAGSASASEIVAGAVQDTQRGLIIGEQTFGKGSVQIPHKLQDGSELRVTIAEWLTPARRQIHGEGISPDIMVEMSFEDVKADRDPQLERAIREILVQ